MEGSFTVKMTQILQPTKLMDMLYVFLKSC